MEHNEALKYFVFVSVVCILLFIWFAFRSFWLDERFKFLTYAVSAALSATGLALWNSDSIHYLSTSRGAVYTMSLEYLLMTYAVTGIFTIRLVQEETWLTNQPIIPRLHQELTGEGAAEKKLTMFAIKMSILDLMASGLALLKCSLVVWKTQGVMIKLITVLSLILEGIRIGCRNRGLELHHMHIMQQLSPSIYSISRVFYWLHLIFVLASGVLSLIGLRSQLIPSAKPEEALVFFYVVAILEALVFLAAKIIWMWKMSYGRLLEKVKDECGLELSEMDSIKRFLYDAYYKCVTGNILDVPKMNLVTFAEELLVSTSGEEQFMGTRILMKLLKHPGLSDATLGKILTSKDSKGIARLIQMLNENSFFEVQIRSSAAEIVSMLVDKEPNMMQHVAGMEEAIKSANDLLGDNMTRARRDAESAHTGRGGSTSPGRGVFNGELNDSANDYFTWKKCLLPASLYMQVTSYYARRGRYISYLDMTASILVLLWGSSLLLGHVFTWKMKYFVFVGELCVFEFIRALYHSPSIFVSMVMELFSFCVIVVVLATWSLASEEHDGETEKAHKATGNLALNAFYIMTLTNTLLNLVFNAFYGHVNSVAHDDQPVLGTQPTDQPNIPSPHQESMGEGAPEKKLTMFVRIMGILDLMVSFLGLLKYSLVEWESLGSMVKLITVLTLILEGVRMCSRNRGLELSHMHIIQQLPLLIRFISWHFYWLHLISVLTSGVLSTVGLATHNFGKTEEAPVFFYAVAILEALVFLSEKAFWEWHVSYCTLFKKLKDECGLDTPDMDSIIRRFFYDAYYKCVTGNIFVVSKMDLVTFAEELLVSTSGEEQLMGTRILMKLSSHPGLSDDTLCKIGTSEVVIPRVIQMLYWVNYFEEEIRLSAAEIVSKLDIKVPNMKHHVAGMDEAIKLANDLLKIK